MEITLSKICVAAAMKSNEVEEHHSEVIFCKKYLLYTKRSVIKFEPGNVVHLHFLLTSCLAFPFLIHSFFPKFFFISKPTFMFHGLILEIVLAFIGSRMSFDFISNLNAIINNSL